MVVGKIFSKLLLHCCISNVPFFSSSLSSEEERNFSSTDSNVRHSVDYAAILNLFRRRIYVYLENNQPSFSFNLYFSTSTLFFSLLPPFLSLSSIDAFAGFFSGKENFLYILYSIRGTVTTSNSSTCLD